MAESGEIQMQCDECGRPVHRAGASGAAGASDAPEVAVVDAARAVVDDYTPEPGDYLAEDIAALVAALARVDGK